MRIALPDYRPSITRWLGRFTDRFPVFQRQRRLRREGGISGARRELARHAPWRCGCSSAGRSGRSRPRAVFARCHLPALSRDGTLGGCVCARPGCERWNFRRDPAGPRRTPFTVRLKDMRRPVETAVLYDLETATPDPLKFARRVAIRYSKSPARTGSWPCYARPVVRRWAPLLRLPRSILVSREQWNWLCSVRLGTTLRSGHSLGAGPEFCRWRDSSPGHGPWEGRSYRSPRHRAGSLPDSARWSRSHRHEAVRGRRARMTGVPVNSRKVARRADGSRVKASTPRSYNVGRCGPGASRWQLSFVARWRRLRTK